MIILALMILAATPEPSKALEADTAATLKANRPAMLLWNDTQLRAIYRPYFDCYWLQVKSQPDSNLENMERANKMFEAAYQTCSATRHVADGSADRYLSNLPNYGSSSSARADILSRYRRQVGVFSLTQHYADAGKANLINEYYAKIGRASRESPSHAAN